MLQFGEWAYIEIPMQEDVAYFFRMRRETAAEKSFGPVKIDF